MLIFYHRTSHSSKIMFDYLKIFLFVWENWKQLYIYAKISIKYSCTKGLQLVGGLFLYSSCSHKHNFFPKFSYVSKGNIENKVDEKVENKF